MVSINDLVEQLNDSGGEIRKAISQLESINTKDAELKIASLIVANQIHASFLKFNLKLIEHLNENRENLITVLNAIDK